MRIPWLIVLLAFTAAGCSGQSSKEWAEGRRQTAAETVGSNNLKQIQMATHNFVDEAPLRGQNAPAAPVAAPPARKIVFNASIDLLVDNLDHAEQQLRRLVRDQGGYIARSQVTGSPGSPRSGNWVIRVPVEKFQTLRDAILGLGEMHESRVDSDDITDQYYDLSARIKNKQQEESRLLDLLKKSTGNLKDILAVEENLTRVRGEIEQMQGQLQRWEKESALATVNVALNDHRDYVPASSPSFSTSVGRTFGGSLDNLIAFGRGVALLAVAVSPWLPVMAVLAAPVWLIFRRSRRPEAMSDAPVGQS